LFDWYGVGDTGCIAAEGPDHDGLYIWEDAHYLEVLDVDSNEVVAEGERGNMVVSCLFKDDVYPIIRFNTCDVTEVIPGGNPFDLPFRRIRGFLGRSDNMVKLRGINIYPHGVGVMMEEHSEFTGEYITRAERDDNGRDEMTVVAEVSVDADDEILRSQISETLKRKIGIEVKVELVPAGGTADMTEIDRRQKPLRLIDTRFK